MRNSPTISVVMPAYNVAPYVGAAVDSIVNQTFADFEFLVVDDGSADATPRIIRRCPDPRLRFMRFETNRGTYAARNWMLRRARGRLVAFMDADDIALPERFEKQVRFLTDHPDVGVVGTAIRAVDRYGRPTGAVFRPQVEPVLVRWGLLTGRGLVHPTAMVRRELFARHGLYDSTKRRSQDYEMWTRLALHTRLANLPEVLLLYRRHGAAITATTTDAQRREMMRISLQALRRHLGERLDVRRLDVLKSWSRNGQLAEGDILPLARLIYRLCRRALSRWPMTDRERSLLLGRAAEDVWKLAVPGAVHRPRLAAQIIGYALALKPALACDAARMKVITSAVVRSLLKLPTLRPCPGRERTLK